jgi:hypothetical protein
VDLSPGGDSLLVALDVERALGVIDLRRTPVTVTRVPLAGFEPNDASFIHLMRTASNGKTMLLVSGLAGSVRLLEVDLALGTQRTREDAVADGPFWGTRGERSGDHSTIAIIKDRCIGRYDAPTDRFIACRRLDVDYEYLALDRRGQLLLAGLDLYDATGQRIRTLDRPFHWDAPKQTSISPDGADAYYGIGTAGLAHVRVSDGRLVERIVTPSVVGRTFISPDGKWLVALPGASDPYGLTVIDLRAPASAPVRGRR